MTSEREKEDAMFEKAAAERQKMLAPWRKSIEDEKQQKFQSIIDEKKRVDEEIKAGGKNWLNLIKRRHELEKSIAAEKKQKDDAKRAQKKADSNAHSKRRKRRRAEEKKFKEERKNRVGIHFCDDCDRLKNMTFSCWVCGTADAERYDVSLDSQIVVCNGSHEDSDDYEYVDFDGACMEVAGGLFSENFQKDGLTHMELLREYGCNCKKE